jgi:SRSO17 transposase
MAVKGAEPTKYWLSDMAVQTTIGDMVKTAKMRWRIEQDNEELKQEFGLSHYEGRDWTGFHHHTTCASPPYGFLTAQRLTRVSKKNAGRPEAPASPGDYRPRGSRSSTTPCA